MDWLKQLSQPTYTVLADRGLKVMARDGTRLACDVFRPDASGTFPALLSYSVYGKDIQRSAERRLPLSPARGNGGLEAGNTEFFVSRGYVHVIADCRGSGDSDGVYDFQGRREQEDGYDLIEWISAQPWCNGNVGMLGMSYFAVIQYLVAATQPPHLKAIAPYEAYSDRYRHSVYHGGILNEGFYHQWWGHVSVGTMRPLSFRYLGEEEALKRARALMKTPEVADSPFLYITLKYPEKNPLLFDFLINPHDGPFYWERSPCRYFEKIKIPCFIAARWSGWPIHLPGALAAWAGIDTPKRMLLMETPSIHGPLRPWDDHKEEILRWYDHWLKGNDTGMMDEPPIRLLIKGSDRWLDADQWPPKGVQWTKLHLTAEGSLTGEEPSSTDKKTEFVNDPAILPGQRAPHLQFSTEPLLEPLAVIGPIALRLQASLNRSDATLIVSLKDRAPDGSEHIVTKGWLRASHRQVDESRSKPGQPFHPHQGGEPIELGRRYVFAIDVRETAHEFLRDHRLILEIAGQDTAADDPIWYHLCNPVATRHILHFDASEKSHVVLPVLR